jgi:glycosyltransferase involved in cell wall biosynthesis
VRLLHVVEASFAGVGRHVLDLAEGLLARGHRVDLAYSPRRSDASFRDRLARLEGLQPWTVDLRREPHPSDLAGVRAVWKGLRTRGPFDLVHGHSSKGGAVARLAAAAAGVPAVYTPHAIWTMDPTSPALARSAVAWAERLLARVNGLVIAVSPAEGEHLARLGIPPRRRRVVLNGIRAVDLPTGNEARCALELPREAVVVGFVGRLAKQKAPDVLVSAFRRVARAHPEALLALVGEGPLRPMLQRQVEQLGLKEKVRWLGERDGQRAMVAFDVLVLPSRYEGLPYVLLEALAAGVPIVATEEASGGLVVEPGVNGLIVPVDDPGGVADAILRLLSNDAERSAFGRAARCRAAQFSQDRMVEETEGVYREAVEC